MTYKGVLVEDIPNLAWIFGYTNASWTLKSDIAGDYLCRLFKHMDDNGHTVATPRDVEDCATGRRHARPAAIRLRAARQGHVMPRQGSKLPWKVLMHYEKDSKMLLEDPIDDGAAAVRQTAVTAAVA